MQTHDIYKREDDRIVIFRGNEDGTGFPFGDLTGRCNQARCQQVHEQRAYSGTYSRENMSYVQTIQVCG